MTANEGMKLVAPLAGAGLFASFGGPAVALLDAATFALAAAAFAVMPVREPAPKPGRDTGWWVRAVEGGRYLRGHQGLRRLVVAGACTMFLAGLNGAAIYAVVDAGLHRPPAFTGVLYAVQGVGSVIGGVAAGPLMRRMPERWFAAGGIVLFAVGAGLRALPSTPVALVASGAVGFGLPTVLITALTAVQRETPAGLVGRVAATANTIVFVPNAVALGVGAALVASVDFRFVLAAIATGGIATAFYCSRPAAVPESARTMSAEGSIGGCQ
jgi:hypothetical protein